LNNGLKNPIALVSSHLKLNLASWSLLKFSGSKGFTALIAGFKRTWAKFGQPMGIVAMSDRAKIQRD